METLIGVTFGEAIGKAAGIVTILSVLFEISPIKFNPISAILNWIGKRTNAGIAGKIEEIERTNAGIVGKIEELENRMSKNEAIHCRVRILTFSDELRCGLKHSQESFEQVLSDIDDYEKYCETHPNFVNNKTVVAKSRILSAYEACLDKDSFL